MSVCNFRMTIVAIVALATFALHTGCSDSDDDAPAVTVTSGSDGSADSKSDGGGANDALSAEAAKVLQAELAKHWLKTSDGWFSQHWAGKTMGGERVGTEDAYIQVKEFKLELRAGKLSEADKLNKFEFNGQTRMTSQVSMRSYGFIERIGYAPTKQWSPWESKMVTIQVFKRDGQWTVKEPGEYGHWLLNGTKPDAATVAKLQPTADAPSPPTVATPQAVAQADNAQGGSPGAADTGYLKEMPDPDRVFNDMKGKDNRDTAERQWGAFHELKSMMMDLRPGGMTAEQPAEEVRLQKVYMDAMGRITEPQFDRARYDFDEEFRGELLKRYFSAKTQELYRATKDNEARESSFGG